MDVTNEGKQVSMRARVQAFGGFLTNMVLPNDFSWEKSIP